MRTTMMRVVGLVVGVFWPCGQRALAQSALPNCNDPSVAFCETWEQPTSTFTSQAFNIAGHHGRRCGGAGFASDCSYSKIINEDHGIPPYPEVGFPQQTGTLFVHYQVRVPESFWNGVGNHGYYVRAPLDSGGNTTHDGEPNSHQALWVEYDPYNLLLMRGHGYERLTRSFEGVEPGRRGSWHSYQIMIVPSNQDANVGRIKVWIDGELALFSKINTLPAYSRFWSSDYWHSVEYVPKDTLGNAFEKFTAPNHPAFELHLDNLVVSRRFVEFGSNRFQVERLRFAELGQTGFAVHFDSTQPGEGWVEWGQTTAYGNSVLEGASGYFHRVRLDGLGSGGSYHLRACVRDDTARVTCSDDVELRTDGPWPRFALPGWAVEFYHNLTLAGTPAMVRSFQSLTQIGWTDANWGSAPVDDNDDLVQTGADFSVRYSRDISVATPGVYSFKVVGSDTLRLSVDGVALATQTGPSGEWDRLFCAQRTLGNTARVVLETANNAQGGIKFLRFQMVPEDSSPPRVLSRGFFAAGAYQPERPYLAAKCDEPCRLRVEYGPDATYGAAPIEQSDRFDFAMTRALRFPALTPGATYHYRLTAYDACGNGQNFGDQTFVVGDTIPPQQTTNLVATRSGANSIRLTFTAPGADGRYGTATAYDLRFAPDNLDLGTWASASPVTPVPSPVAGGTNQTVDLTGFPPGPTTCFGLTARDENGNRSKLSNIACVPAKPECLDLDSDGYGVGCAAGDDCDDYRPEVHAMRGCATDGRSCGEFRFCELTCPAQPVDRTCSCWGLICDMIFKDGFE